MGLRSLVNQIEMGTGAKRKSLFGNKCVNAQAEEDETQEVLNWLHMFHKYGK